MKQKSKIIQLKNKQNRLKFWHRWGGWILCVNALIPIMLLMPCVMANISPMLAVAESLYLGMSVLASFTHELFGEEKIRQTIQDTDQKILKLVKTDEREMQILREHDKIEHIQKDVKEKQSELKQQKELVKELIKKKNLEAKSQQSHIKYLTRYKKQNAKAEAVAEVEELEKYGDILDSLHLD